MAQQARLFLWGRLVTPLINVRTAADYFSTQECVPTDSTDLPTPTSCTCTMPGNSGCSPNDLLEKGILHNISLGLWSNSR